MMMTHASKVALNDDIYIRRGGKEEEEKRRRDKETTTETHVYNIRNNGEKIVIFIHTCTCMSRKSQKIVSLYL
jgi:hypothetical protein